MRNRTMQRKQKTQSQGEKALDYYNAFNIRDPTPYQAILNLIESSKQIQSEKHSNHSTNRSKGKGKLK